MDSRRSNLCLIIGDNVGLVGYCRMRPDVGISTTSFVLCEYIGRMSIKGAGIWIRE